jgi:hypothetical protein
LTFFPELLRFPPLGKGAGLAMQLPINISPSCFFFLVGVSTYPELIVSPYAAANKSLVLFNPLADVEET